jgi:hypothetical protein
MPACVATGACAGDSVYAPASLLHSRRWRAATRTLDPAESFAFQAKEDRRPPKTCGGSTSAAVPPSSRSGRACTASLNPKP